MLLRSVLWPRTSADYVESDGVGTRDEEQQQQQQQQQPQPLCRVVVIVFFLLRYSVLSHSPGVSLVQLTDFND